jgi:hypothetical protein
MNTQNAHKIFKPWRKHFLKAYSRLGVHICSRSYDVSRYQLTFVIQNHIAPFYSTQFHPPLSDFLSTPFPFYLLHPFNHLRTVPPIHLFSSLYFLPLWLLTTNFMDQSSPPQANIRSASQDILHLLRNKKIYYRVYHSPPLVRILSNKSSPHSPTVFPCDTFQYYHPPTLKSSNASLPFGFSDQNSVRTSIISIILTLP